MSIAQKPASTTLDDERVNSNFVAVCRKET